MVLPPPTSKPIPVVGVRVAAFEILAEAVQAVIVLLLAVAMPDEVGVVPMLRKAVQWVSDDPLSAKMPMVQLLKNALQLTRFDPTPAESAQVRVFVEAMQFVRVEPMPETMP